MPPEFIQIEHQAYGTIAVNLSNVLYAYMFGPSDLVLVLVGGEKLHTFPENPGAILKDLVFVPQNTPQ